MWVIKLSEILPCCHLKLRAFFFMTVFSVISLNASSATPTMSHVGMDAYLLDIDCRSRYEAKFDIQSQNPRVFDGDRIELQRLIGQLRAVVSIECPSIRRITVKGTVNKKLYFAGASEKDWSWKIIGLFSKPK